MEPPSEFGPRPGRESQREPVNILDGMLALAIKLHRAGRLPDAELAYRKILGLDPQHAPTLCQLAALAHQVGQLEAAVQLLGAALLAEPEVADYHARLGAAYEALGRPREAAYCLERALELNPGLTGVREKLRGLRAEGRPEPSKGLQIA